MPVLFIILTNKYWSDLLADFIIVFDEYACEKWTESNAVDRFLNEHPNLNLDVSC